MDQIVIEKLQFLTALSLDALHELPTCTEEKIISSGARARLVVHHDKLLQGEHLFVVQVLVRKFFGVFTKTYVEGFAMDKNGLQRDLLPSEKWQFY